MIDAQIQLSNRQFEDLSAIVYRHCGINLHDGKRELVQARIAKRMRVCPHNTIADYLRFAVDDEREFMHLIDALSTNLTSFFRESEHFSHLKNQFLPELLMRKRNGKNRTLRGWSAGCSTGQEPYTIAMVLLDATDPGENWDMKILATDLSTAVLEKAREGSYESGQLQSIPPQLRSRYVTTDTQAARHTGRMSQRLKDTIRFAHLNLMKPWPFNGPFDFIFCRNVMIYFDKPTQQQLVGRFWDILDHGGLLFTGHSESLTGITHRFQYVQPTIYAKR